ncbi:hypothetical protein KAU33_10245 [Candidatus Dependentiae bacterium]|nr:hypothetical protein [Candidatus Dependentiae bacterium]
MKKILIFSVFILIGLLFLTISASADNYDKALDYYNAGVDLHDSNPDAALKNYFKALNYDTSIAEVYLNIGLIYINKNDLDQGEKYTLQALETFVKTKKKVSGSQTYERLVAICNSNIGLIYLKRMAKVTDTETKQKYLEYALTDFLWALEVDPTYSIAKDYYADNLPNIKKSGPEFYDDGVDYLDKEKSFEAIIRFKIAIDLDPSIGEAHLNTGLAYMREGDYYYCEIYSKEAINTFRKYKKVIAQGQTIEELIAICYLHMGLAYIGKARDADDKGNYSDAEIYHKTALEMWKKGMTEDPTFSKLKKAYAKYEKSYKE